jgi:hypothetical protein
MINTMHGVSVKLSAAALTAGVVEGIEWTLTTYAHWTIAAPWTTYLALAVGYAVGWAIPETAKITHGDVTVIDTDPATNTASPTPVTPTAKEKEPTMSNILTNENGNIVTASADEIVNPAPVTLTPVTLTPGQAVEFEGTSYTVNPDGTLEPVALDVPEEAPVEEGVVTNEDGTITVNGVTYRSL